MTTSSIQPAPTPPDRWSNLTPGEIRKLAADVSGDDAYAERWMQEARAELGGRSPEQAIERGEGDHVVGILLRAAGL